jgi:ribosome-interacting GTPase 1
MPINADYEYFEAEKRYLQAQTLDERIIALEEMIRKAPKHKGAENLLAELKTRLKKFKEKSDRVKKSGGGRKGIKKEGFQIVLMGYSNSGKSSLLAALTNARPVISPHPFSTIEPCIGTLHFEGVPMQLVDLPSVGSDFFDIGIVNTADCIAFVVDGTVSEAFSQISSLTSLIPRATTKNLFIIFSKIDLLDYSELRKLQERCKSRRLLNFFLVSSTEKTGLYELQKAFFESMGVVRVYTREPGRPPAVLPIVLPAGSTVRDVGESIRNGFSNQVIETRLTGPSAKFANQKVGLSHIVKDKDIVEFHTR